MKYIEIYFRFQSLSPTSMSRPRSLHVSLMATAIPCILLVLVCVSLASAHYHATPSAKDVSDLLIYLIIGSLSAHTVYHWGGGVWWTCDKTE